MTLKKDFIINNYKPVSGEEGYGKIIIPKGVKITHMTAMGIDENYHFIDDLSWIEKKYSKIASILSHDMYYHNFNIPKEFVDYEI